MNHVNSFGLRSIGFAVLVLFLPLLGLGQCEAPMGIDNLGSKSNVGFLIGQSFVAEGTGEISTITLGVCDGVDAQIVVREYSSSDWNAGNVLETSQLVAATSSSGSYCLVSQYGSSHYATVTFEFESLNVESGNEYVIELISGVAINSSSAYTDGLAYGSGGETATDLWFELVGCEDETMVFGCTDSAACSGYDDTATVDDGSCQYADCNGDCGGAASVDSDCGCVGGTTGLEAGYCLGCTDDTACNFDASAAVDDGSCAVLDCNNVCGGSAVMTDCGCAGGTTELDPSLCIDGCWVDQMANDGSSCNQSFFIGQSLVIETTGWIKSLEALSCSGSDMQIVLRSAPLSGGSWNSGIARDTSNMIVATSGNATCAPSSNGSSYYEYKTFVFEDINSQGFPVEAGDTLVVDFLAGFAMATCTADYTAGEAVSSSGAFVASKDIGFRLNICADETVVLGCMDASACNYLVGATYDDGSCAELDCSGVCGGTDVMGDACDCDGNALDAIGVCGGSCAADEDNDGICDDVDACVGILDACGICGGPGAIYACGCSEIPEGDCDCDGNELDACGVCNGPGAIYECGCSDFPEGDCDCEGSEEDALGVCGGSCSADADNDGICDDVDTCVGELDACGVCNGPGPNSGYDCDGTCLNDIDSDGVCDAFEIDGCTDSSACNYDVTATDDDSSCTYAAAGVDCSGACLADADADGICDDNEIVGCQDDTACNYDATATDSGSCSFAASGYDCAGDCLNDTDGDGICNEFEITGCTYSSACNYDSDASDDDGSCQYAVAGSDCSGECLFDTDNDGICDQDEITGCQDNTACNYDNTATNAGYCDYAVSGYDCSGACLVDTDNDGICDAFEAGGCTDSSACNYDASATDDDSSCTYAASGVDCSGACLVDTDNDGICDQDEITGCQDNTACNYDNTATNAGYCDYAVSGYDCSGACLVDTDNDGICDAFEAGGCTDSSACNYDASATDDDSSCTYAASGVDCSGACLVDTDNDGICDQDEITGCQDNTACNYDNTATNAGYCDYAVSGYDCSGACLVDTDNDGICDAFEAGRLHRLFSLQLRCFGNGRRLQLHLCCFRR